MRPLSLRAFTAITVVGILLSTAGFASNTVDFGFFGVALTLASMSGALTYCVKSDHPLKRISEVVLLLGAFGAIFYGYFLTESLVLAALTVFITVLIFVGFTLSYVLPKIRSRTSKLHDS